MENDMEIEQFNEIVMKLLEGMFSQPFTPKELSHRHYSFSGKDFDFSFPLTLKDLNTEKLITDKINRWLENVRGTLKTNEHYLFDENGKMWQR